MVTVGSKIVIQSQAGAQLAAWRVSEVDGREVTLVCTRRQHDVYPHTRTVMVGVMFYDGPMVKAQFRELGNGSLGLRVSLLEGLSARVDEVQVESLDKLD